MRPGHGILRVVTLLSVWLFAELSTAEVVTFLNPQSADAHSARFGEDDSAAAIRTVDRTDRQAHRSPGRHDGRLWSLAGTVVVALLLALWIRARTDQSSAERSTKDDLRYTIRPFESANLDDVLRIERRTAERPWTEAAFRDCMSQPTTDGSVAWCGGRIVGFSIVDRRKNELVISRLAVDPSMVRCGAGSALIHEILRRAASAGRTIRMDVAERRLTAQLFLKRHGFFARSPRESDQHPATASMYAFSWPGLDVDMREPRGSRAAEAGARPELRVDRGRCSRRYGR